MTGCDNQIKLHHEALRTPGTFEGQASRPERPELNLQGWQGSN